MVSGLDLRYTEDTFSAQSYQVLTVFNSFVVEDSSLVEHYIVSLGLWFRKFPTIAAPFMFLLRVGIQTPSNKV
jgi:hypothetical protein